MTSPASHSSSDEKDPTPRVRPVLFGASLAHAIFDGVTEMPVVFYPLWQTAFHLSLAEVGFLRMVWAGTLALCQIPATQLAKRFGTRLLLCAGTLLMAVALVLCAKAMGLWTLTLALTLGGIGASVQHPLATLAITKVTTGAKLRSSLSTYNVTGDIGRLGYPALAAALISLTTLSNTLFIMAGICLFCVALLAWCFASLKNAEHEHTDREDSRRGFQSLHPLRRESRSYWLLLSASLTDQASRVGLWVFLPFVLTSKGAGTAQIGLSLSLLFLGGMGGKLLSGYSANRFGTLATVAITEVATASLAAALWYADLSFALVLCPFLGLVTNGTSSALFASVVDLAPSGALQQSYSIFYTAAIGVGALSPPLFGLLGDTFGLPGAIAASAMLALSAIPFMVMLRPELDKHI